MSLPITDYVTDTKSVLDQIPRVLGALLDIAILEKSAFVVQAVALLSQHIAQAVPISETAFIPLNLSQQILETSPSSDTFSMGSCTSELQQLPGVTPAIAKDFVAPPHSLCSVRQLALSCRAGTTESLPASVLAFRNAVSNRDKLMQALTFLPLADITNVGVICSTSSPTTSLGQQTQQIQVKVTMQSMAGKSHSPASLTSILSNGRHHKPKAAGYWCLVTQAFKPDEKCNAHLVAGFLKIPALGIPSDGTSRAPSRQTTQPTSEVVIPCELLIAPQSQMVILDVWLMSDMFVGTDVHAQLRVNPSAFTPVSAAVAT